MTCSQRLLQRGNRAGNTARGNLTSDERLKRPRLIEDCIAPERPRHKRIYRGVGSRSVSETGRVVAARASAFFAPRRLRRRAEAVCIVRWHHRRRRPADGVVPFPGCGTCLAFHHF